MNIRIASNAVIAEEFDKCFHYPNYNVLIIANYNEDAHLEYELDTPTCAEMINGVKWHLASAPAAVRIKYNSVECPSSGVLYTASESYSPLAKFVLDNGSSITFVRRDGMGRGMGRQHIKNANVVIVHEDTRRPRTMRAIVQWLYRVYNEPVDWSLNVGPSGNNTTACSNCEDDWMNGSIDDLFSTLGGNSERAENTAQTNR